MTRIYLIRHAEAEGNLYRIYQGQRNTLVTEEGKMQIRALAERFRDIHVDAVYSSDLYRAEATAAGICRVKDLPLKREPALREICVGDWEGYPVGTVARERAEEARSFRDGRAARGNHGAETGQEVTDRVLAALRRIAAAHDGQDIAVVSHGAAIRYALSEILKGVPDMAAAAAIGGNTSVTELEVENGAFRVVSIHDTSHLDLWMETLLGRPWKKRDSGLEAGLWYRTPQGQEREAWLRAALGPDAEKEHRIYETDSVLLGVRDEEPTGILALLPETEAGRGRGWIDILWVKPELRGCGCGIQLLGQAVYRYRALGREFLRIAVKGENAAAMDFLTHHGFVPAGTRESDGSVVLEKDIAFRPIEI